MATTSKYFFCFLILNLFSISKPKSISSCCKVRTVIHDNMVLDTLVAVADILHMGMVLAFVDTL